MTRGERGISIRPYAPGDEAAMAALVAHTLRVSNRADYSPEYLDKIAESHSAGYFAARAADSHFYVACDGSGIVGCGGITARGDESLLVAIFVCPDLQGAGLGRRIVRTLEADEYFTRARRTELAASLTAVGFYEKLGYSFVGGVTSPDAAGVVRMEKYGPAGERKT